MAVTLNEVAKLTKDPFKKGFILDLLRYSDILNIIPFVDAPGLKVNGTRWQTLPSVGFRKVGGSYTESTGTVENIQETLAILGGEIHIDRVVAKAPGTQQNPLKVQMNMKAKALAFQFSDTFVNGDLATNPDSFEGLKKRVANMPARMTLDLSPGSGDSLKVLADSTNMHKFVDAIHEAKKVVDGANYIFCNERTWLGLGKVARRLNLYQEITDALGRRWDTIGGVPFVDIGLKSDKSTEIIPNDEDPGDGGNDATSLYVCRIDTNDGLHGLQIEGLGMDIYDPTKGGEDPTAPRLIRRIDWAVGLYNLSNYCIARVKNFKMDAS